MLFYSVTYSGPSQIPNMKTLVETVSGCKPLAIFTPWIFDWDLNVPFILIFNSCRAVFR